MTDINDLPPSNLILRKSDYRVGPTSLMKLEISCAGPISASVHFSEGLFRQALHWICVWAIKRYGGLLALAEYRRPIDTYWIENFFGNHEESCVLGARFMQEVGTFPSMVGSDTNPIQLISSATLPLKELHKRSFACGSNIDGLVGLLRTMLWTESSLFKEDVQFYCETPESDRWFQLVCYSSESNLTKLIDFIQERMPYVVMLEGI